MEVWEKARKDGHVLTSLKNNGRLQKTTQELGLSYGYAPHLIKCHSAVALLIVVGVTWQIWKLWIIKSHSSWLHFHLEMPWKAVIYSNLGGSPVPLPYKAKGKQSKGSLSAGSAHEHPTALSNQIFEHHALKICSDCEGHLICLLNCLYVLLAIFSCRFTLETWHWSEVTGNLDVDIGNNSTHSKVGIIRIIYISLLFDQVLFTWIPMCLFQQETFFPPL